MRRCLWELSSVPMIMQWDRVICVTNWYLIVRICCLWVNSKGIQAPWYPFLVSGKQDLDRGKWSATYTFNVYKLMINCMCKTRVLKMLMFRSIPLTFVLVIQDVILNFYRWKGCQKEDAVCPLHVKWLNQWCYMWTYFVNQGCQATPEWIYTSRVRVRIIW